MGSAASGPTRAYSVENSNSVIDISDNVVKRLKNQLGELDQQQSQEGNVGNSASGSAVNGAGPVTQIIYTNSPGSGAYSSQDMARDREEALTKNDMFWQKRINQIEVANNRSAQVLEKEYNQSVDNVKKMFVTPATRTAAPACEEQKKRLMQCYKDNKRELLVCSQFVQEFSDCVDASRHKVVDAKAAPAPAK